MNLRSFEKVNLRAASIRSKESSESLILFVRIYQLTIPPGDNSVSAGSRMREDSRCEEVRTIQIMPIFLTAAHMRTFAESL